jgi:hypothetical protein
MFCENFDEESDGLKSILHFSIKNYSDYELHMIKLVFWFYNEKVAFSYVKKYKKKYVGAFISVKKHFGIINFASKM